MATHVATFISHPAAAVLDDNLLARVATIVQSRDWHWLAAGVAADLPIDPPTSEQVRQVHVSLHELPIDIIIQPQDGRRKQLFLADMDSTMIGQECIDELADFVALKPHVAEITARAMRGEIAFEPALRERVALLKGIPVSVIDRVIRERITLTAGAQTLIATLRAHGVYTVLVSGGFSLFTKAVAEMIGFDDHRGNVLSVADGKLEGRVEEPILGRQGKLECLQQLTQQRALPRHLTMAVGDGANDLAMLQAAGLGVAFHAKPHVAAKASARIDHGDLTALLFAQGYAAGEFR
jgi:phosphoserine phosphatase